MSSIQVPRCLRFALIVMILLVGLSASTHVLAADGAAIKLALVGDSTVVDKGGWGPGLAALLDPSVEVINLARSGASSKNYRTIGQWKKVLEAKPDWILIQFGHNDMPGKGLERETDPKTTFRENLARYVDEARAIGAKPVLVTPLTRRTFGPDGKIRPDLDAYAEAARAVALDKKTPLIDLNARSIEELNRLGPEKANEYNPPAPKEEGKFDHTHLTPAGAKATGKLVADELKTAVPDLARKLK